MKAETNLPVPLFLLDVLIQCFRQSCMDDLAEDLVGYGEQSDASPVVAFTQITLFGNLTMSPVFHTSGIVSLYHISLNMYIKGEVFQFLQP